MTRKKCAGKLVAFTNGKTLYGYYDIDEPKPRETSSRTRHPCEHYHTATCRSGCSERESSSLSSLSLLWLSLCVLSILFPLSLTVSGMVLVADAFSQCCRPRFVFVVNDGSAVDVDRCFFGFRPRVPPFLEMSSCCSIQSSLFLYRTDETLTP